MFGWSLKRVAKKIAHFDAICERREAYAKGFRKPYGVLKIRFRKFGLNNPVHMAETFWTLLKQAYIRDKILVSKDEGIWPEAMIVHYKGGRETHPFCQLNIGYEASCAPAADVLVALIEKYSKPSRKKSERRKKHLGFEDLSV